MWRLSANGTRAYLFCRKKINGENREVLIALDLETGEKQEWPVKGKWLALSPSEEQVAMLDGDTQDKKKTLIQLNLADMETGRETQVLRSFQKENRGAPRRFVWLKAQLFAVAQAAPPRRLLLQDRTLLPQGLPRHRERPHRRSEERRVGKECRSRWSPYH